jgi:UDP-2-acetamido-3-amino-2,3-dideoxy-glucuronate N-acetyltransferase
MRPFIHESSFIDAGVTIGEGTKIWHFCHVQENAVIGKNCVLGQNVNIASGVRIGDGVKIQNNVSVYAGVTLEDGVFCGPSVVFTNDPYPRAARLPQRFTPTRVCEGASIGSNATIVCGVTIGRHAMVAAGSVVTRDVADYALVMGVPARQVGRVCPCGGRLDAQGCCTVCGTQIDPE